MRLPIDAELQKPKVQSKTADEYIQKLKPKLELARQMAKENLKESQTEMKEQYDRNTKITTYRPGDKCWLFCPNKYRVTSRKLHIKWRGPYLVIRRTGLSNYILMHCGTQKEIGYPVNVSRMKRYFNNRDRFYTYDNQRSAPPATQLDGNTDVSDNQTQQTNTNEVQQSSTQTASRWENALQIKAVKTIDGQRYFLVEWEDPNEPPTWTEEQNVGQGLITQFYLTHTKRGTKRRNYRSMQYQ